ncbi:unnamed protein product [Caenorhabditis auriculariae]|uniref:NAD(P)-binding domain-containing protein n=1 Tax=Caenorhabditis auriculariae TaxID=2777116 RepID=A0A8S1HW13_9PELO|nr:unnamed protein product [Caenorhabditis auriculariae]
MTDAYLITGGLSDFANEIIINLSKKSIRAVVLHNHNEKYNKIRIEAKDAENVKIFNVDSLNEEAITKIIIQENITTVIDCSLTTFVVKSAPLEAAQKLLLGITSVLDAVRKSGRIEKFVLISGEEVYGNNERKVEDEPLTPVDFVGSAQMSVEAMVHSYAVSYRTPTVIARLSSRIFYDDFEQFHMNLAVSHGSKVKTLRGSEAAEAVFLLSKENPTEPAEVFNIGDFKKYSFSTSKVPKKSFLNVEKLQKRIKWDPEGNEILGVLDNWGYAEKFTEIGPIPMIYGSNTWIGRQFIDLLKSKNIVHLVPETEANEGTNLRVREEILEKMPSHVFFFGDEPNQGNYEGDCFKLRENVAQNLYAPWLLASVCQPVGLHFTYVGTGDVFGASEDLQKEEDEGKNAETSYTAVKRHTEKLLRHFEGTLQCRVQFPVNGKAEEENPLFKIQNEAPNPQAVTSVTILPECLPLILDLALKKKTGVWNTANKGAITFGEINQLLGKSSGSNNNNDTKNTNPTSNSVVLDTSKLESEFPELPTARESLKTCITRMNL